MQITTLIPAYRPKYLIELLACLRNQTVKPDKIIFSDDSPDSTFLAMLTTDPLKRLIKDLNIEVVLGPRSGGLANILQLLKMYRMRVTEKAEVFHFLCDDDIIYPNFYEKHLQAYQLDDLKCVVSRRWTAMESGQPIQDDMPVPMVIENSTHRMLALDAPMLFAHTVGSSKNWLGEFSNATFKAEMAELLEDNSLAGISYAGLEDLGAFLKASLLGSVGYIQDHLGYFRRSAEQSSSNPMGWQLKQAFLAYIGLAIAARNLNVLSVEQSRLAVQNACIFILSHYQEEADMHEMCLILPLLLANAENAESDFLAAWQKFSKGNGTATLAD